MDETLASIIRRLGAGHPAQPGDMAELRRISAALPASPLAPAALLRYFDDSLDAAERDSLRARVAVCAGDPAAAVTALDPSLAPLRDFYPPVPEPEAPSTEDTIDTFLATYGHTSPEEEALLERMIFNPVPEYAETLAKEDKPQEDARDRDPQDVLIDAFLAANPVNEDAEAEAPGKPEPEKPRKKARQPEATAPADSLLSESLAKIFIKQGRYERAYEIISGLNLNYPEKSIYFADQLRYLRKLIIIQKAQKQTER